jgi:hypothetical protein
VAVRLDYETLELLGSAVFCGGYWALDPLVRLNRLRCDEDRASHLSYCLEFSGKVAVAPQEDRRKGDRCRH